MLSCPASHSVLHASPPHSSPEPVGSRYTHPPPHFTGERLRPREVKPISPARGCKRLVLGFQPRQPDSGAALELWPLPPSSEALYVQFYGPGDRYQKNIPSFWFMTFTHSVPATCLVTEGLCRVKVPRLLTAEGRADQGTDTRLFAGRDGRAPGLTGSCLFPSHSTGRWLVQEGDGSFFIQKRRVWGAAKREGRRNRAGQERGTRTRLPCLCPPSFPHCLHPGRHPPPSPL